MVPLTTGVMPRRSKDSRWRRIETRRLAKRLRCSPRLVDEHAMEPAREGGRCNKPKDRRPTMDDRFGRRRRRLEMHRGGAVRRREMRRFCAMAGIGMCRRCSGQQQEQQSSPVQQFQNVAQPNSPDSTRPDDTPNNVGVRVARNVASTERAPGPGRLQAMPPSPISPLTPPSTSAHNSPPSLGARSVQKLIVVVGRIEHVG